ncbi:MAG TPA: sulfatase-like hydrolase/transferase [Bryobacteraceae bacterium]|nr:sulfatase-like hydrolase/transferase [Bryobacteraceae bacterium]
MKKAESSLTRRAFSSLAASGALVRTAASEQPNIVWLTCEDTGPELGCYGDRYADTPTLDRLASRGLRYDCAWSNAPVCAPARTTIISGVYPTATGSENMRSLLPMPAGMKMYPQYLREAGYYVSNNSKEDYNLEKPGEVWHDSSSKAHWRNRKGSQPFFSVFNFLITHESQIRTRPHSWVHDPAKVRIPAYHPDTIESRQDWAQYYDNITTMDRQAADVLAQLAADGLADDTIVFFYGDHGSGMPRSKRWPYNSGLHVPLIVHFPEKWRSLAPKEYKPGGSTRRLVSFVDLAPTLLSLAGIQPPVHMQGHAFMGRHEAPPQPYLYGFRGRMDERYDLVRSVRDDRFVYMRQYMPHLIYGQHIAYMFQTPTTQVWRNLYDKGKLNAAQRKFWEPKEPEELFDLTADRDEIKNLAADPAHKATLERFRKAEREWVLKTRDVGFLSEDEVHTRSAGSTPYDMARIPGKYDLPKILATASTASMKRDTDTPALVKALGDPDSAVRRWAVLGLRMRGSKTVKANLPVLRKAMSDPAPAVRIAAAETLGLMGAPADLQPVLDTLIALGRHNQTNPYVQLGALNAIDSLGKRATPLAVEIDKLKTTVQPFKGEEARAAGTEYIRRALENISQNLA